MEYIVQNSREASGNRWNVLETTVSYKARVRLTPTLTHVITYELVTSGAEDRAMSCIVYIDDYNDFRLSPFVFHYKEA